MSIVSKLRVVSVLAFSPLILSISAAPDEKTDTPRTPGTSVDQSNAASRPFTNANQAVAALNLPERRESSGPVFIENRGQFDPRVRFQVKTGSQIAWLTTEGIVFDASRPTLEQSVVPATLRSGGFIDSPALLNSPSPFKGEDAANRIRDRLVFSEDFVKSSCCSKVEGKNPRPGIYNYFQSSDPARWRAKVQGYSEVVYHDLWRGVDLRIYGNGPDLEQEFIIQPGSDLSLVEIAYRGIEKLNVDSDGALEIHTAFGRMRETPPRIYQELAGKRETLNGRFDILTSSSYRFQVDAYKPEYALVVDPTLLYSTFLGGSDGDYAFFAHGFGGFHLGEYAAGIAVDASGNAYVAGFTNSTDFPTTTGAFRVTGTGGFVSKLNTTGSTLIYSTYLGPSISAIAVDSSGRAYVTGANAGQDFPTTANAYQPQCGQLQDMFVTALDPTGSQLAYSTCFGAIAATPAALAVDARGRVFLAGGVPGLVAIAGHVVSSSVPTSSNAFQAINPSNGGAAFVTVIDSTASGASSLVYGTYLGIPPGSGNNGPRGDGATSVTVDAFGKIYVAGYTTDGFPATVGAFQTAHKGDTTCSVPCGTNVCAVVSCHDGFIAKLDPLASTGVSSLIYSTYLGGAGEDAVNGIAVDGAGNAYVTGTNYYADFPVTPGAFQTTGPNPNFSVGCAFVAKLNAGGSALAYSTYIRNSTTFDHSAGNAIRLDSSGDAYIAGITNASDFPVTPDAAQSAKGDPTHDFTDAFLTKLNPTGSGLLYSSYLGGSGNDVANALAIDPTGDVYVTGYTESLTFPITPFAFQPVLNPNPLPQSCFASGCHGGDAFVTKVSLGTSTGLTIASIVPVSGGNAGTVSPQIFGTGLHDGATAKLSCAGQSPIAGANLSVGPGGRFLNTTFDLTATLPGKCDVVVANPDGGSVTLQQAFTVQQGGAPNIRIYVTGVEARRVPPEVPIGPADALIIATASNTGNVDSTGGFISLSSDGQFTLTSASPAGLANATQGSPDDFEVWPSVPIAAGRSQIFTATETTSILPVCASDTSTQAQACFSPLSDCHINNAKYVDCLGRHFGDPADLACLVLEAACAAAPANLAAALGCIIGRVSCTTKEVDTALRCAVDSEDCVRGAPICFSGQLPCRQPSDPNNIMGPLGVGGQRWVEGTQSLSYVVSFNNEPTATVPAQEVVVTQPLGANVNLSTLTLTAITVPNNGADISVPIGTGAFNPAAGVDEFATNVDLRPKQSLLVSVDAKLNPATQTLTWTFTSIDPATGMPPLNPLIGFLPPGAGANVSFSVTPKAGLATGSQVAEQATIIFQGASPMSTPTWTNTIDNAPPASHVSALAATSTCPNFRVSWSGSDIGSGLQGFTVYASDNGGQFKPWLSNTTTAAATYTGSVGHTYSFYSIASDLTGNVEPAKTSGEASTMVASAGPCGPPSLSGQVLSSSRSGTTETVNLQLTNTGFTLAQAVSIKQITARTLSGSGIVTMASPALPAAEGSLAVGASTTVTLTLNVPSTVIRFSLTENGTTSDGAGNTYNYSSAQTLIP